MPNKEICKTQPLESKAPTSLAGQHGVACKVVATTAKVGCGKDKCVKDATMSPGAPTPADAERTELLGSLTTQQQQRTSARVIKKLRLEPPGDRDKRTAKKDGSDEIPECETPSKLEDKELKFPTVKQRMPKALWSTDEKNLFFEALNEYGKDFDAITAYICGKMKKKGMPDLNLKTKTQVSHFYYRTWHKLSKHVHFDENVKKVAQELYALINYGELRKKLVSVNEKTCARLGEMVLCGSMAVRARGRNVRVRTPMCRALRRLNQISEAGCGARVVPRALVQLRARDGGAWARVQAAAHNPRAAVALAPRTALAALLRALQRRWRLSSYKQSKISESVVDIMKCQEDAQKDTEDLEFATKQISSEDKDDDRDLEDHLNLEPERIIVQEQKASKKLALHVGPRPGAEIHLPVISPSEQLSSQKICFSSYLERMGKCKASSAKIRTPKRQRKDSTTDKDKDSDQKKFKMDDTEKLFNIEETAIDGIELMANYKVHIDDEEKPSTEDEKERETADDDADRDMGERDKDIADKELSEKEKDSFSEMEDDEKYNKSDTDNESDPGKEKSGKATKFKNLKVKFRIRPKKRGGSIYTLVTENPEEPKGEEPKCEDAKSEEPKSEEPIKEEDPKPDIDVDMAIKQIRKGWSASDAGELTIGDLYLMFGARSKLELDYWWAEPTPPLPQPQKPVTVLPDKGLIREKSDKTPDKGADSSVEDEKERRESDSDMMSPKNTFSQDSNDGMSGDERKSEQLLASPEHKSSAAGCSSSLKLVSKLINRPHAPVQQNGFAVMSDRLKRLLALAGNPHVSATGNAPARCNCGHVCAQPKKQVVSQQCVPKQPVSPAQYARDAGPLFRHPTPIAPRADHERSEANVLDGVPRWRRGRPRLPERRVVVQRLLPLLPKLPPPSNLIPVKCLLQPSLPPAPPKILPKPPPTSTSDLSFFYVLSESNGQFFFHDGDRRIPITALPTNSAGDIVADDIKEEPITSNGVKSETGGSSQNSKELAETETRDEAGVEPGTSENKTTEASAEFLPAESLSLSPSRLLRDTEGWLGASHDFSLSSFLGQLEGREQPEMAVDSQLQSLMAESSVDYVAKFADLAAEVSDDVDPIVPEDLT